MRKPLQELTIMDSWMFGAVMLEPNNCRQLLELALDKKIDHVDVIREKSLVYNPQYKGVRLDVYAKDDNHTRFNVEMQVQTTPIPQRSSYFWENTSIHSDRNAGKSLNMTLEMVPTQSS